MIEWIKNNVKTFISIFGVITAIGGFVIGVYIGNSIIKTRIDNLENQLSKMESTLSGQQASYDKMMWFLMNRKQTKVEKAKEIR